MLAHVLAEAGQRPVVLGRVVGAGEVEERRQRSLGVHRDRAAAGQRHHEVGTQPAVVEAHLLGEVAVVDQPGELDRAAQVELAPLPAHLRLAQRGGQGAGLAAQRVGREAYVGHLLVQLGLPRHPVVGEVAQLVLQALEPVLDDGVVGDALLERDHRDVVLGPAARPQHADEGAEAEADGEDQRQGEQQGEGVHGASMERATDNRAEASTRAAGVVQWQRSSRSPIGSHSPLDYPGATAGTHWTTSLRRRGTYAGTPTARRRRSPGGAGAARRRCPSRRGSRPGRPAGRWPRAGAGRGGSAAG